jgi:hypothetical protein
MSDPFCALPALAACPSDLVDVPTYLFLLVQRAIDHVGAGGRLAGKCGETGYNGYRITARRELTLIRHAHDRLKSLRDHGRTQYRLAADG